MEIAGIFAIDLRMFKLTKYTQTQRKRRKQYRLKHTIILEWISSDSHIQRIDALNLIGLFCAPVLIALMKRQWENGIKTAANAKNLNRIQKFFNFFLWNSYCHSLFRNSISIYLFFLFRFHHKQKRASRYVKSQCDTDPSAKLNDVRERFSRLRLNIPWYCCCCCCCFFYFFFFF